MPPRPFQRHREAQSRLARTPRQASWCRARRALLLSLFCLGLLQPAASRQETSSDLSSARLYPLEEIGCTLRQIQLLRDEYGRLAVAHQDELFVLNDTTWLRRCGGSPGAQNIHRAVRDPGGTIYYGAFGAWGMLKKTARGDLEPLNLAPCNAPAWTHACEFRDLLCTPRGVFFWGQEGLVFRDYATGAQSYFAIKGVCALFPLGARYIVSTFDAGFFDLDLATGACTPAQVTPAANAPVVISTGDGVNALLLATSAGEMFVLQQGRLAPVSLPGGEGFPGQIVALDQLPGGGYAAAIAGGGVVLLCRDGKVSRVLDGPDYRDVVALEAAEAGVLWVATERGVSKILLHQPYTAHGAEQGIVVSWPQVEHWRGRTVVSSGGRVFATQKDGDGPAAEPVFATLPAQPESLGWGIAAVGDSLLLGGYLGVHEVNGNDPPKLVLPGLHVARLVPLDTRTCLVLAADSIAVIKRENGSWTECAARIAGLGYPYVVHGGNGTAWLELGMNRVARVHLQNGQLKASLIEQFPWKERSWVNVSLVGNTAILSAAARVPLFLDSLTLAELEEPALRSLVDRSPYHLQRFARDSRGILWVSHSRGLFPAHLKEGRYEADLNAYSGINETVPLVKCLASGEVWASTDKRLYQVHAGRRSQLPAATRPLLVAMKDTRTGAVLPAPAEGASSLGSLRYEQNSLQLDFFSGSYAWTRPLAYEYRLGDENAPWERANAGFSVFLPDLHEGDYKLAVRTVDTLGPRGEPACFDFSIEAPWYRSWFAYTSYPFAAVLVVFLALRYSARRHRLRLAGLERQINARTLELRNAMDCLREEATANATLAERNRLAGEIHDSLEQGFAGLWLQLESTSRLPGCTGAVHSGLSMAITMVQYCRDELRNAVRGLNAPALATETLETAVRRVAGRLAPLADFVRVQVDGCPRRLSPAVEHHLLRIVQEALGNVVKHAGATKVDVLLQYAAGQVSVTVTDDGRGFDPAAVERLGDDHLGLPGFARRARIIGGTLSILSSPGRGTSIRVQVPEGAPTHSSP